MKKRKMKGKSSEEGVDRISDISDEVLSHILSFLPTKEAVGTCLLSKRWRHVWEMVPALDIKPESTLEYHTNLKTFLRLRRTKMITRLHLECDIHSSPFNFNFLISKPRRHSDCSNYIQEWVEEAVAGEVEQVNLSLKACQRCHEEDDEVSFSLPISLLTCTTIVTMKIEGLFILHVPSCIELLSLKSLHLNVQKCKPSCGKFLSGSPALEVFYLKERDLEIERNSQSNRIISNKRSHRLVIESDPGYDYVQDYLKGHLKNVVKAKVFIELHKVSSKKFPILKAIRNVEYLCLSDWNQSNSYLDVQQFPNLLHLELDLKSDGAFILPVLSSVQPPSPKSLDVEVQKCKRVSCKEFLSRSPALKVFYLKQKCGDGFEELKIERNSHTNLIVSNNPLLNLVIQSDGGYDYVQDYFEGQLENVVKAKVCMTLNAESSKSKVYEVYSHGFSVLKAICNVEFLSLSDKNGSMDGVSLVDGVSSVDLPKLPNLVQLQLHIIHHYSSLFLKLISRDYCPKLEVYGVNHMHWKYCEQQKKWINMTTYGTTYGMQPHHSGNLSWGCKTMRLPSDFGSGQDG